MRTRLLNFVAYQVAWFAVLICAARGIAWAGAAAAVVAVAIHAPVWRSRIERQLIVACLLAGLLVDSTLAITGQVHYAGWHLPLAPFWMLSLWAAFATTLNHSMRWLMQRPAVAALGGAIGGPLAYLAGERLGALQLAAAHSALPTALTAIALLWAPALWALSVLVMRATSAQPTGDVPA